MEKTDVIIIGAGPTGLALACQLIRHGVDFVIIDRKESTTPFSRAIGVQARTLEIYEQIGLADKLIGLGKPAEKVRMVAGGEVRGEAVLANIGAGMSKYPFMLVVEQGKHEALLYDFIRQNGRDVRWQTELSSLSQGGDGVTVELTNGETIRAKYLVGCDGSKSRVRHSLGLTFEGDTVERLFYVADVEIEWEYGHDALVVCLAERTLTAFFPMAGDNRFRIVGTFPDGHAADEADIIYDEIERQIVADTSLKLDISHVNWFSTYKVHSRAVNKFSEGRCFVAGDAAHIHTPAGGQGMNTGIQDGYNLAWKLALVCKGDADTSLLDTYNEERLPNARRLLRTTDRFFEFGSSDEWFIAFVRMHIFPHVLGIALSLDVVKKAIFPLVSQIGISYRDSSLSAESHGFKVHAGDRMPWLNIYGESIYDLVREPTFHLLTFGCTVTDVFSDLLAVHDLPLTEEVIEHFGSDSPFAVLLRPDNYIALITDDLRSTAISEYLDCVLKAEEK